METYLCFLLDQTVNWTVRAETTPRLKTLTYNQKEPVEQYLFGSEASSTWVTVVMTNANIKDSEKILYAAHCDVMRWPLACILSACVRACVRDLLQNQCFGFRLQNGLFFELMILVTVKPMGVIGKGQQSRKYTPTITLVLLIHDLICTVTV